MGDKSQNGRIYEKEIEQEEIKNIVNSNTTVNENGNSDHLCKHGNKPSLQSCWQGFCRNVKYAFGIKALAAVLFSLSKPSKSLLPNLANLLSKSNIKFCLFLGTFVGSYKLILLSLRKIFKNKDHPLFPIISGFLSGFSILLLESSKLKKLILLAFVMRALDTITQLLDKKKIIKKIKYFECYMFGPIIATLVYIYFYEKPVFAPGIDKAFKAIAQPNEKELALGDIYVRQGIRWFPGAAKKIQP
ncbi:unnamed protein product [Moneuplotes crassus]|uniref:Transmembrane protein n=1 Tax=Euplotes crassus TaxID=5936 RepID=A0AAD2D194_EUPCR|nr:unnamed protein product [Moneuplotes crassus]